MVKRATAIPPTVINMNAARARKRGGNQEGGRIGAAIRSGLKRIVTNSGVQRAAASALGHAAAAVGVPQSAIQAGTSFVEGKIQAGEARRAARAAQTGAGHGFKADSSGQGGAGQEGGAIMRQSRRGMVGGRVSKKAREMGVERLIGTRYQVFDGTAYKTKQGLTKKDFFRRGTRVISLKASQNGKRNIAKNPKMVPFKKGKAA
jgi:hypothetical protein